MDNTRKSPLKAVIFDWAGVFCSPGEPFSHKKLKELTGLSVDEMGQQTQPLQKKYYKGEISIDEFWQCVIKQFNLPLTVTELSDAYLSSYNIYPDMLELAKNVRTKKKTALLSNLTSEMMSDIIRKYYVNRYFDHVLFSNEIGYIKPEPESFGIALEKLGTKPGETLFIDDSNSNVEAAKKLGFQTILFTYNKENIEKINSLVDSEA